MAEQKSINPLQNPELVTVQQDITWSDLEFLSTQSLGLRHVENVAKAVSEKEKGIVIGDAVSLSGMAYLAERNSRRVSDYQQQASTSNLGPLTELMTEDERQKTISDFRNGVKDFLAKSISIDLSSYWSEHQTLRAILTHLHTGPSFILAKFLGARFPYDISAYHDLGKCGQETVPPEKIQGLVLADRIISTSDFADKEQDRLVDKALGKKVIDFYTEKYWTELVRQIHELKVKSHPSGGLA